MHMLHLSHFYFLCDLLHRISWIFLLVKTLTSLWISFSLYVLLSGTQPFVYLLPLAESQGQGKELINSRHFLFLRVN